MPVMPPWLFALCCVLFGALIGFVIAGVLAVICRPGTKPRAWFYSVVLHRPDAKSLGLTAAASPLPVHFYERDITVDDSGRTSELDDGGNETIYVIDGVEYSTETAAPPPPYEVAVAMRRPEAGDVVRFVVRYGDDGIVFEYAIQGHSEPKMNKLESCVIDGQRMEDVPRYCGSQSTLFTTSTLCVSRETSDDITAVISESV